MMTDERAAVSTHQNGFYNWVMFRMSLRWKLRLVLKLSIVWGRDGRGPIHTGDELAFVLNFVDEFPFVSVGIFLLNSRRMPICPQYEWVLSPFTTMGVVEKLECLAALFCALLIT